MIKGIFDVEFQVISGSLGFQFFDRYTCKNFKRTRRHAAASHMSHISSF